MKLKELKQIYNRAIEIVFVDNISDKGKYDLIFSEDIRGQLPFIDYEDNDSYDQTIHNFMYGFQKYIEEVELRESNKEVEISEFNQDLVDELIELRKFKLNSNTNKTKHAIQFADWVGESYDQNPNGTWGNLNRTTEDLYKLFVFIKE